MKMRILLALRTLDIEVDKSLKREERSQAITQNICSFLPHLIQSLPCSISTTNIFICQASTNILNSKDY